MAKQSKNTMVNSHLNLEVLPSKKASDEDEKMINSAVESDSQYSVEDDKPLNHVNMNVH